MPEKKNTQERPINFLEVPIIKIKEHLDQNPFPKLEDYFTLVEDPAAPGHVMKKPDKKAHRGEVNVWMVKLFKSFGETHPGHIINTRALKALINHGDYKNSEEPLGLPLGTKRFRAYIPLAKKVLNDEGKTLHNVRGQGYCLATPDQHQMEAMKQIFRSVMYLLSALKLKNCAEFAMANKETRAARIIELFGPFTAIMERTLGEMTDNERALWEQTLTSQILTPSFVSEESYLEKEDQMEVMGKIMRNVIKNQS